MVAKTLRTQKPSNSLPPLKGVRKAGKTAIQNEEAARKNFYDRFRVNGEMIDFYRIALLYGINDPCIQHALKKLLRAGRSHKSIHEDVQNAIDTLKRWQELNPK